MKNLIIILILLNFQAHSKSLIYCMEGSPKVFNPILSTDGTTLSILSHTYNRLFRYSLDGKKLNPILAKSYSFSKDKLTLKIILRKGIQFHSTKYFKPTRNFNAEDVKFTFDRMLKKDHPYHKVSGGTYIMFNGFGFQKLIKEIKIINPYEVHFILNKTHGPFLDALAHVAFGINSKEYGSQLEKTKKLQEMDSKPIGTGPFVYGKYITDQLLRMIPHKDYFKGKAKIDNLIFTMVPESGVRLQKLKTKECHIIRTPGPHEQNEIEKNKKLRLISKIGFNLGYLAMNTSRKPFDNILVRKAINHGLNKNNYIKAVYLNKARIADNIIIPNSWSYDKTLKSYKYDVEKAKSLLKKAGYPNGFKTTMHVLPVNRPYIPNGKKLGEMMQADLKKIGIELKIETYDWATYLDMAKNAKFNMMQLGQMMTSPDPDELIVNNLICNFDWNISRWCNPKFENYTKKAREIEDQSKRFKLYQKAQRIFYDDAPWVPIAHGMYSVGLRKEVKGYEYSVFGTDSLENVEL